MPKEKQPLWNKLEPALSIPIEHCKICFKPIKDYSFHDLIMRNNILCEDCFSNFAPKFIHFNLGGVKGLAIYEYDQNIKELLYKYKGCYDFELKDVFLDRYILYLKLLYYGYYIVPLPSYHSDDQRRGFNHVVEIYNRLNLPMLKILVKTKNEKQAKKKKIERLEVYKNFAVTNLELVRDKKILIVDDVFTTGSSINAAMELLRKGRPKKISVLVVAKNMGKDKK